MDKSRKRPTGADVAREAGVNQASVSRVFTGKAAGRVSPEIEDRIRRVARDLGYEPNVSGRLLRSGKAHTLGLVVTDFEHPYFGALSRGAQRAAAAHGRSLILMEAEFDGDVFVPYRALDAGRVDGLLVFSMAPPDPTQARAQHVTLIESEQAGFTSVVFDTRNAMRGLVQHLAEQGHRHVAYLDAALDRWTFEHRRAEWEAMVREYGDGMTWVAASSALTIDVAAATVSALLRTDEQLTALVCVDDILAAGAYRAAEEAGLSIPQDLSVISFGGTVVGNALWPRLTTMTAPGTDLGERAVELHMSTDAGQPQHVTIPVTLNVHSSTSAPPG